VLDRNIFAECSKSECAIDIFRASLRPTKSTLMKRILAIDGGGIRGLIPAALCREIESRTQKSIYQLFHLIAGTSTGGIIAMALATRRPASEMVEFYRQDGQTIFSNPRGVARYWTGSKYDGLALQRILRAAFETKTVSDAVVETLVPTYDLKYRAPVLFTRESIRPNDKGAYLMSDVAIATSAAPTYFPPYSLDDREFIDGGVVANNPAALALGKARELWPNEELTLVSLGTGALARSISGVRAATWGDIRWARPVIDCIFDGTSKATEDVLDSILDGDHYWRFQYGLSELTETLDGASKEAVIGLQQIADSIIRDTGPRFDQLIELLKEDPTETAEIKRTREVLAQANRGIETSLKIKNRMFTLGIQKRLSDLLGDVTNWEKSTIRVPADDRGRFLVGLYEDATANVFSTRLKSFSGTFRGSSLTEDILQANIKSGVPTKRVFVFDSKDDVSGFDYQEMARQDRAMIDVRVLISDAKSLEDFTIIDDSAVGITEFVGPRDAAARWTFGDQATIFRYQTIRDHLLRDSIPFSRYAQGNHRLGFWLNHELSEVCETNIDSYQNISRKYFGENAADDARVLELQQHAGGGIYLLKRLEGSKGLPVGIFCLIPLSTEGFRGMEVNELTGAQLKPAHIANATAGFAMGYYLGAIAGDDRQAQAILVDVLRTSIRELAREDVESIFARPVTEDGLQLLTNLHWAGLSGRPQINQVCRLRL
jgi:predicted acylesterase/phospholipase RssA